MRFYARQHQFYCGVDLHARSMYVCIVNQEGDILTHRNMEATAPALLNPSRIQEAEDRWIVRSFGNRKGLSGEAMPLDLERPYMGWLR